jgi:hypothetical protein
MDFGTEKWEKFVCFNRVRYNRVWLWCVNLHFFRFPIPPITFSDVDRRSTSASVDSHPKIVFGDPTDPSSSTDNKLQLHRSDYSETISGRDSGSGFKEEKFENLRKNNSSRFGFKFFLII